MFGPPLYDAAIKAQERSFQTQEAPLTPQPDIHTGAGAGSPAATEKALKRFNHRGLVVPAPPQRARSAGGRWP